MQPRILYQTVCKSQVFGGAIKTFCIGLFSRTMAPMRQSHLFTKTRREAPKDEVAKNAQLLIRAGFVHKEMAGVYSYLPLGFRVLEKIVNIIREEMNAIGGQEMHMSALQDKALWERTDRWDDKKVDNWFKTSFKTGGEAGLGFTHEEPLTRIMVDHISSYRDMPLAVYQFQNKFRNELRAKSGIIRGKEFLMKDMYSFSRNEEEHKNLYEKVRSAYIKVFKRLGIAERTYVTSASGGVFSQGFSEEFQTLSGAGEDVIYVDENRRMAVNDEVATPEQKSMLTQHKTIEVGNIFNLGTKFSAPLGLTFTDEKGKKQPVIMGSYGLGPTRLMGTLVEVFADKKGIVWPESVAPFRVHLVEIGGGPSIGSGQAGEVKKEADELYRELTGAGVEVLFDDRDTRAGEKFADSDLIGIPMRVIVSASTLAAGKFECVERESGKTTHASTSELIKNLSHA